MCACVQICVKKEASSLTCLIRGRLTDGRSWCVSCLLSLPLSLCQSGTFHLLPCQPFFYKKKNLYYTLQYVTWKITKATHTGIKGTVARDLFALFFLYQTFPPGPFRDVLGPFHFLAKFHRVIELLKRFLVSGTPVNWSEFNFFKRRIKCICIVNNRFWLFFDRSLL